MLISRGARAQLQSLRGNGGNDHEAALDWDRWIELGTHSADRVAIRQARRFALSRMNDDDRTATAAGELSGDLSGDPVASYHLACVWSLAAGAVLRDAWLDDDHRPTGAEEYAGMAIRQLLHIRGMGFFRTGENPALLRDDSDLSSLRGLPEFSALVESVQHEGSPIDEDKAPSSDPSESQDDEWPRGRR